MTEPTAIASGALAGVRKLLSTPSLPAATKIKTPASEAALTASSMTWLVSGAPKLMLIIFAGLGFLVKPAVSRPAAQRMALARLSSVASVPSSLKIFYG